MRSAQPWAGIVLLIIIALLLGSLVHWAFYLLLLIPLFMVLN